MDTPKSKTKSASSLTAPKNGAKSEKSDDRTSQQKEFSTAVSQIAKRYGVKVGLAVTPTKNPYAMSPEQAAKVALQAGIITRAGNLKRTFK
jgi:hypothetical protein